MQRLTDEKAKAIERLWQKYFPSAIIFPEIGFPSNANGVMSLTHQMHGTPLMKINGLTSRSPLANNALYTTELSEGKYINFYEVMVSDFPGSHGEKSTAQIYIDTLEKYGLSVSASHYHWTGAVVYPNEHGIMAIHHYSNDLSPWEFSKRTIKALLKVMKVIEERAQPSCESKVDKKPWTWDNVKHDQTY